MVSAIGLRPRLARRQAEKTRRQDNPFGRRTKRGKHKQTEISEHQTPWPAVRTTLLASERCKPVGLSRCGQDSRGLSSAPPAAPRLASEAPARLQTERCARVQRVSQEGSSHVAGTNCSRVRSPASMLSEARSTRDRAVYPAAGQNFLSRTTVMCLNSSPCTW